MKTNLLKLALCAFVAALPIGAWAYETETIVYVDYAKIATDTWQVTSGNTGEQTITLGSTSKTIDGIVFNTFSATVNKTEILSENSVYTNDNQFKVRCGSASDVGLRHTSNDTHKMAIVGLKKDDIVEIALNGGNGSTNPPTDYTPTSVYNLSTLTKTSVYTHSFTHDTQRYQYYHVYRAKVSADGDVVFSVATTAVYIGHIKVTRVTNNPTLSWNFEQYMSGVNMLGTKTAAPDYVEYADGLYLHSRDADAPNHLVATADVTLGDNLSGGDITSQTKTYKQGKTYTAIVIKNGDNSKAAKSATSAADNKSYSGLAYTAPADGTLYYTYYVGAKNGHIYTYTNGGDPVDNSISFDDNSNNGKGGELSVSLNAGDYVCITTSTGNLYILDVTFKPTSAVAKTKEITITSAGYATFCANENYTWTDPNLKAYVVSSVNETAATMQQVNMIPAGTGVILAGPTGDYTLTSTESVTRVGDNYLRANLMDYVLPANDGSTNYNYTLAAGPTFKHSSGSGTLAAGKAFLRTTVNVTGDPGAPAPALSIVFADTTPTGIETINNNRETITNNRYFNLNGQRVAQPTKGLYIVNGRKVVLK